MSTFRCLCEGNVVVGKRNDREVTIWELFESQVHGTMFSIPGEKLQVTGYQAESKTPSGDCDPNLWTCDVVLK